MWSWPPNGRIFPDRRLRPEARYGCSGRHAGKALREVDGARGRMGGLRCLVRGARRGAGRAPCGGGPSKGPQRNAPYATGSAAPTTRARGLEASRHLAVRDDRPLRRAEGRLPRGRRACLQDALGGAPELALHRPLRGAGDRDGALRHGRDGDSASGARDGYAHMAPAGQSRRRGEGCRRLFGCRARRDRRHREEARPELHQHHGRPRRAARHSRHRRKGQGRRGQALRRARGAPEGTARRSRRSPATWRRHARWGSLQRCPRPSRPWTGSMWCSS